MADGGMDATEAAPEGAPGGDDYPWICSQRWEQVLFLSWEVPVAVARDLVPAGLELDLYEDRAYVSLLPLKMAHVRLRDLPGMPHLTNFPELNLRTYVRHGDKPGVFFTSLDAPSALAVWIGRHVFHVRYDHADMSMAADALGAVTFDSDRIDSPADFRATYQRKGPKRFAQEGSLEQFLCERYAMYGVHADGSLVRGDIHHAPWELRDVEVQIDNASVLVPTGVAGDRPPDHVAYSDETKNFVSPMLRV